MHREDIMSNDPGLLAYAATSFAKLAMFSLTTAALTTFGAPVGLALFAALGSVAITNSLLARDLNGLYVPGKLLYDHMKRLGLAEHVHATGPPAT